MLLTQTNKQTETNDINDIRETHGNSIKFFVLPVLANDRLFFYFRQHFSTCNKRICCILSLEEKLRLMF